MTTHTPGPWTVNEKGFVDGVGFRCLATVRGMVDAPGSQAAANARLIAAAPDMFAALKAMTALPVNKSWSPEEIAARKLRHCARRR